MAAPTNTYCDYAAGNDYKGATFADGAYTQATKTLTKAGAFTASQVNHWLYITGTHITAGYYKISSIAGAPNAVVFATDASSDGSDSADVNCTQAAGTTLLPWRSIQGALDLITRDATNGDQVNIKVGTAQVNQAALALTVYGTPGQDAPLILRGYTTAANDGGIAEIDCNGNAMWAAAVSFVYLVNLDIHKFGNNNGVMGAVNGYLTVYACKIHNEDSSPSGKTLVHTGYGLILGSYVYSAGTTGTGITGDAAGKAINNYVYNCPTGISSAFIFGNIVVDCTTAGISTGTGGSPGCVWGNTVYSSSAATGSGISSSNRVVSFINNIIEGYSGAGGKGISLTGTPGILGYNAFYNNTTPESITGDLMIDIANDATLAASPFTNAAGGDFSLNTAVVGAIDGAFPGAWYGPASTTDHADIGAVQNGAGAGGNVNHLRGKL